MKNSKSINVYLIDGTPTGRIKCTMQNWTGVAYKIPRNLLDNSNKDNSNLAKHIKQTGVYFLLGENENGEQFIYIGQARLRKNNEGLSIRLQEHKNNPEKDYWNEAIILTTQNDSLGPTEISYLENKFCTLALEANRYIVKNGNEPNPGHITEEKESEMEEFIDYAKIIIGVLGHKVFEPIITKDENTQQIIDNKPIFYFKGKYSATATITNDGFVVLKGSKISIELKKSVKESVKKLRKQCANKIDKNGVLLADIICSSPSAAASFVGGCSLSGNACWHSSDGKNPKDYNI